MAAFIRWYETDIESDGSVDFYIYFETSEAAHAFALMADLDELGDTEYEEYEDGVPYTNDPNGVHSSCCRLYINVPCKLTAWILNSLMEESGVRQVPVVAISPEDLQHINNLCYSI